MRPLRLAKDRRNVNEKYARSTGTINPKLPKLPLAFIGLAAYRAWIELTFVGSYFREAPYSPMARDAFDLSMMAFLVLGVLFAKRLTPLIEKQSIRNTALFMLLISTACVVGGASFAEWGAVLSLAGAIIGGAGIAITLILWSELYSCLNPLRVALYYSASIVASALIVYTMKGFLFPWFATYRLYCPSRQSQAQGRPFGLFRRQNATIFPRHKSHSPGSSYYGWQSSRLHTDWCKNSLQRPLSVPTLHQERYSWGCSSSWT